MRFTASTRSKSSSASSRKSQACVMPALLTSTSTRPWRASARATSASTSALRETSAPTNFGAGNRRGGRGPGGLVAIGEHDGRALGGEALRAREADAAGGARDDRHAVLQSGGRCHHASSSDDDAAWVTRRRAPPAAADRRTTRSTIPDRACAPARPGVLHREQVVARGDPGPAIVHDVGWRAAGEERVELRASVAAGLNLPSASRFVGIGTIDRAGNMPGHGIERLDVASIPLAGAGIDEQQRARARDCRDERRRVDVEATRRGVNVVGGNRPACRSSPGGPRASTARIRRRARRRRRARASAASTTGARRTCRCPGRRRRPALRRIDAEPPERRGAGRGIGQRMPSVAAGPGRGKIAVEVRESRARHVTRVGTPSGPSRPAARDRAGHRRSTTAGSSRRAARSDVLMSVVNMAARGSSRNFSAARCACRARAGGIRGSAACRPPSATGTGLPRCGPAGRAPLRPASMRSAISSSSRAVSMYAACSASTNSRSNSAMSSG